MTTNTIKHLQRDGTWFKFDCLYVNKDDNNSDTFVFIVTNKLDLEMVSRSNLLWRLSETGNYTS